MVSKRNIKPKEWIRCIEKLGFIFKSSKKHQKYYHIEAKKFIIINTHRSEVSQDSIKDVELALGLTFEQIKIKCGWR